MKGKSLHHVELHIINLMKNSQNNLPTFRLNALLVIREKVKKCEPIGAVALAIQEKERREKRDGKKALIENPGPGSSSPRSEEGRGLGRRDVAN